MILVIEVGQNNILPIFCSKNGTTFNKFHPSFQAISQQRSGIKRWFLRQNVPLNMAITAIPTVACNNDNCNFQYLGTSISPPQHSFVLEVFLAGTSNASNNTLLAVLCIIWHEKVNGSCFHTKGINRKPQLYI